MTKFLTSVLKLIGTLVALGAAVYAVVTYWDKLVELFNKAREKACVAKDACCGAEYDDYADWDE